MMKIVMRVFYTVSLYHDEEEVWNFFSYVFIEIVMRVFYSEWSNFLLEIAGRLRCH